MGCKSRFRLANGLKIAVVACCVVFALRGRPPATAQYAQIAEASTLSVEDARQDDAISNLRESTDKSEARLEQRLDVMDLEIRDLRDDDSASRSETRFEFGGIGLLCSGGMFFGKRKKLEAGA